MKVLIACEFSGIVRDAFTRWGHDAWSCDLLPTEKPGNHIIADAVEIAYSGGWDLMVAHPPCTYLGQMSNCRINEPGRRGERVKALSFFMDLVWAPIPKIAIENPRGFPEKYYRAPDQIIEPYEFGHPLTKATCLWLKNLPLIKPTRIVEPERFWDGKRWRGGIHLISQKGYPNSEAWKPRSKTFPGIAEALAQTYTLDEY